MADITSIAKEFFEACEAGKGWEGCRTYCLPTASFAAQSGATHRNPHIAGVYGVDEGAADLHAGRALCREGLATDNERQSVSAMASFPRRTPRRRPLLADRQEHQHRLRLCHGICRRQDSAHDKDLERRLGDTRAWLGVTPPS